MGNAASASRAAGVSWGAGFGREDRSREVISGGTSTTVTSASSRCIAAGQPKLVEPSMPTRTTACSAKRTSAPALSALVVVTAVLLSIFWYIVQKTSLGRAQRACEQDRKMAALLGIDTDRTISLTFVIGAALAAVAGFMFLLYYGVIDFFIGFLAGVKAFTAAVLGGIGSLPGAMLGGLLIGLIEAFWSAYFSIEYKDVATFTILVLVLIFRPTGLLGKPEIEKV